jgi:hypothetical protein
MQKLVSFIFIFVCLNSIAQIQDSMDYNPNLIGNWELHSFIRVNYNDTVHIHQDSVYWNTILEIETDSITEHYESTGKKKDLPSFDEKCKWSIYKEEAGTWITIPCGNNIRGLHEIIFVSETELRTLYSWHEEPVKLLFRRIE